MKQPLVSVIIPTYKREVSFLSRAVTSVLNQTYPEIEIIVIDDSPGDYEYRNNVKNFMMSIASKRVHYKQNETNIGGSLARNRGIELATGDFITFLDDDDEYLPEKIERQLKFMLDGSYDMTLTKMVVYNEKGTVVDVRDHSAVACWDNESLLHYHLTKQITGTPTFMYKAARLREIGGFDDAVMGQEFFLMLKTIEHGLKIGYFPECGIKVYRHDGSISFGKNKITGQKSLYRFKRQYFNKLNRKEIRFIQFRHWAIMAVAYKRNHMYFKMLGACIIAVCVSPGDFISQIMELAIKIKRHI